MKKVSIIIPIWNEEKTLADIVAKVYAADKEDRYEKEVILLDDGSKDKSVEIAKQLSKKYKGVIATQNEKNMGKSRTVKRGLEMSTGDYVSIQDADLEYEPEDLFKCLDMAYGNNYDVVYGNRFGIKNGVVYYQNYWGNKILSFISNLFTYWRFKVWIPDMEVCYKIIRGEIAREIAPMMTATSNFGFEPEITAKLSKYLNSENQRVKISTLPIRYYPRTMEEGKKMHAFSDGWKALKEILKYNLTKG